MDVFDSLVTGPCRFFDGICKIATSGSPIEQLRSMKQINLLRYDINDLHKELEEIKKDAADAADERGQTNPRNPLHFDIIEGGRKRVSDTFIDKDSVSCS